MHDDEFEQASAAHTKQGGYRHGRKRDSMIKTLRVHVTLTTASHAHLHRIAEAHKTTVGEVMDRLVGRFMRQQERKSGESQKVE